MTTDTTPPTTAGAEPVTPRPVSRPRVLKRLAQLYDAPRYLEVGVSRGLTFHAVEAASKVAVDPRFRFDLAEARAEHPEATYHELTSDDYFATAIGDDERFDLIYLDGLHTFEQILRDLNNAIGHLQPRGVIVIDDVRPPTYHASLPDPRATTAVRRWTHRHDEDTDGGDRSWMGDVYRVLWFIDTFMPHLTYRSISNNHGQAVVWRERRADVPERTVAEVADLSFATMAMDATTRQERIFYEIRREVEAMVQAGR